MAQAQLVALIGELRAQLGEQPGVLLELLRRIQARVGYVPAEAVPMLARELSLSRAEVHGVISFYHELREAPAGRHTIRICQAEACRAMGAVPLTDHALARLAAPLGGTTSDDRVTVEAVYCLGNCACSPAVMVDGDLHGRVTPARFDEILGALE